jgi:hypothetical protein
MRSESTEARESGDAVATNLPAQEQCGTSHERRLDPVAWMLLIAGSLFLLAATAVVMYLMDRQGYKTVECVQGAGRVLAATPISGLSTSALVETTVGFYSVSGGIGLSKAEELILQTRANRRRYLCDASQRCMPLL